jgi:putative secretion ATPase (PEP-CTERM system associated)
MYESFYKLRDEPFRLSPDPYYCFKHRSYVKAEGFLRYGVERAEGMVMITGVPGTGKSTLVSDLLREFTPSKLMIGTLVVTRLEADDLFRAVAYAFNLTVEGMDRASVLRTLELFFAEQAQKRKRALLIVDEAQNLPNDRLEDLRLLTNLQMGNRPLLQIFLLGQEGLREKVRDPSLRQLLQRIIAACHLDPLEPDETRAYVEQRLAQAGWQGDPEITDGAFDLIHVCSGGIPRRINLLCSRLFLYGSVDERHVLTAADVRAVLKDFRQELLFSEDEHAHWEEAPRAYTEALNTDVYGSRIATGAGGSSARPVEGRPAETAVPSARATPPSRPVERFAPEPHIEKRINDAPPHKAEGVHRPEPQRPREATQRRLQPVISKGSVNETLKMLEDDDPTVLMPRAVKPVQQRPQQPRPIDDPEHAPAVMLNDDDEPLAYANARSQRRGSRVGMSIIARNNDNEHAQPEPTGHGRSWLTLLLAIALLLTSLYVANPLLRDLFGIDLVALAQDKLTALTGGQPEAASQVVGESVQDPPTGQ